MVGAWIRRLKTPRSRASIRNTKAWNPDQAHQGAAWSRASTKGPPEPTAYLGWEGACHRTPAHQDGARTGAPSTFRASVLLDVLGIVLLPIDPSASPVLFLMELGGFLLRDLAVGLGLGDVLVDSSFLALQPGCLLGRQGPAGDALGDALLLALGAVLLLLYPSGQCWWSVCWVGAPGQKGRRRREGIRRGRQRNGERSWGFLFRFGASARGFIVMSRARCASGLTPVIHVGLKPQPWNLASQLATDDAACLA